MNKLEGYKRLFEISKNDKTINIDNEIKFLIKSEDSIVPFDILKFINRHSKINSISTLEHIYENRRKNKLYKSLVNEKLSIEDKAISMSLLLNNCIIKMKSIENEKDLNNYVEEMEINKIIESLKYYTLGSNNELEVVFEDIRNKLKIISSEVK